MSIKEALASAEACELVGNYEDAARFYGKACNLCIAKAKENALKHVRNKGATK